MQRVRGLRYVGLRLVGWEFYVGFGHKSAEMRMIQITFVDFENS